MPTLSPEFARAYDAFTTMYDALRSLTYHRVLLDVGAGDSKFWTHVRAQLIRTFIIEWTKLLGTDSNEIHRKKLVKEEPAFRAEVLEKGGIVRAGIVGLLEGKDDLLRQGCRSLGPGGPSWSSPRHVGVPGYADCRISVDSGADDQGRSKAQETQGS